MAPVYPFYPQPYTPFYGPYWSSPPNWSGANGVSNGGTATGGYANVHPGEVMSNTVRLSGAEQSSFTLDAAGPSFNFTGVLGGVTEAAQ